VDNTNDRRPRIQDRLASKLLIFGVIGVGLGYATYWYHLHTQAAVAKYTRDQMQAGFEAGVEHLDTAIEAFRNWCLAECAVPYADDKAACQAYLDEIVLIQNHVDAEPGMGSDQSLVDQQHAKLDRYRKEAELWIRQGKATGEPTIIRPASHTQSEK
jgi:hypothetical protein